MIIVFQTLIFYREAFFAMIDRFLRPYYKKLTLQFTNEEISDDDSGDHVFADYDDEKGVVFYPPVYVQRYAAVIDCITDERWCGILEKVVDFGYHNMSFVKYLKDIPGIKNILGVDLVALPLRCSSDLLACNQYVPKRETPLRATLYQGNAADPDYRLIGSDAIVAIEMIEHMLPHDLERFVHTVFGFIKPKLAVITTPNGDFNVLFKELEINGFRRLDHFFEWSREQFNDWCSNIVLRYPQYTVTCKGIGPGPADTQHLGCCSQLALFVSKEYIKQPDLDLNSLALISKQPSDVNLSYIEGWESPNTIGDNNMLCIKNSVESYEALMLKQQSNMTFILSSPSYSVGTLEHKDKMSQCNMDFEFGKNFLMFDDETGNSVLIPRRKRVNRVYIIEDVASRLNCSTFQVKKFSKYTQHLLAKNKIDPFAHSREVVDEIRHLSKLLNFNKDNKNKNLLNGHIWCNINWGENAPYWNQYYKIVREYNYPFEVKSEECRILDAISEEICRLVDSENDEFCVDNQKFVIPIEHFMEVVGHITTDAARIKDLLEWNGYEVVDNVLVYSRLPMDNISDGNDCRETDSLSEWDTSDVSSLSLSNISSVAPDFYGRSLQRVLEKKIHKLRSTMTDENVTTELDRIVCRLMKLALYTCKGQKSPPTMNWMQYKLFDLLSLTEKAIERKRRRYIEDCALKAIEFCGKGIQYSQNKDKTEEEPDDTMDEILSKYEYAISPIDRVDSLDLFDKETLNLEMDDDREEFNDCGHHIEIIDNNLIQDESDFVEIIHQTHDILYNIEYTNNMDNVTRNGSLEIITDYYKLSTVDNIGITYNINETDYTFEPKEIIQSTFSITEDANRKLKEKRNDKRNSMIKSKHSKHSRGVISKTSMKLKKVANIESGLKKQSEHEYWKLQSKLSNPIPNSLVNLCDIGAKCSEEFKENNMNFVNSCLNNDVSNTEDCLFISIIEDGVEERVALRRNVGTDAEDDDVKSVDRSETVVNIIKDDRLDIDNVESQTIFIFDINEPSTSKGVQNLRADVQCGPDVSLDCALSPARSLKRVPKLFSNGIKIEDSSDNILKCNKTCDFGMSTEYKENDTDLSNNSDVKAKGLSVDDHTTNCLLYNRSENTSQCEKESSIETMIIKQFRNMPPIIDDSISEFCESMGSLPKSLRTCSSNANESQIQYCNSKKNVRVSSMHKLVCGGVHVHSFKNNVASEDVMFQGEWQRASQNNTENSKFIEISKRKKKIMPKKKGNPVTGSGNVNKHITVNKNNRFPQKTTAVKNKKYVTLTKEIINTPSIRPKPNVANVPTTIRVHRNVTSVVSKTTTRISKLKSVKSFTNKKTANLIATKNIEFYKKNLVNYLPRYLRRRIQNTTSTTDKVKEKSVVDVINEDVPKDLLKFQNIKLDNVKYHVFQNGTDVEPNTDKNLLIKKEETNTVLKYSYSPQSQSSTCSSPNSISTVRAVKMSWNTITSSEKDYKPDQSNSGFKSQHVSAKYKCQKHGRFNKKSPINSSLKIGNNKENIPQTSRNINSNADKNNLNIAKSIFKGKNKIHLDHSRIQSCSTKFAKKNPKSIKLINSKSNDGKVSKDTIISESKSISINEALITVNPNTSSPKWDENDIVNEKMPSNSETNEGNINSHSETNKKSVQETTSSIMSVIRGLLEDRLPVTNRNSKESLISCSDIIIVNNDESQSSNSLTSPLNNIAVVSEEFSLVGDSDNSITPKRSMWSYAEITPVVTELDSISLMSVASTSYSKFSEYYLADNELDNTLIAQQDGMLNESSVQDIFERKYQNKNGSENGFLEAFSAILPNASASLIADSVNTIDSETGNLALASARLTGSDDLAISGRSSDTYESCFFDDDTYVPNWLFDAMSQQQSIDDSEALDESLGDASFDASGDTEPGVGPVCGAGDGKGIHSDQSQDSSGQGTSLSSSDSSGQGNEAILVDLSNVTAFERLSAPATSTSEEASSSQLEAPNGGEEIVCGRIQAGQVASDVDADVSSSMDTDAIDSDA